MTALEMVLIGPALGAAVPAVLLGGKLVGGLVRRGGLERARARSVAAATAPLHGLPVPEADRELVDTVHDMLIEARTDEHPMVWLARRKAVTRRPARWQRIAAARRRLARAEAADPLRAPLDVPLERSVATVGLVEPAPWDLESFTAGWTTAEIARIVDEVRAGAR